MGPGIVVEHRNFDDSGLQGALCDRAGFGGPDGIKQGMGLDPVRVETDLKRRIGQTHVQHTVQLQTFHGAGHRHALEKGFQ